MQQSIHSSLNIPLKTPTCRIQLGVSNFSAADNPPTWSSRGKKGPSANIHTDWVVGPGISLYSKNFEWPSSTLFTNLKSTMFKYFFASKANRTPTFSCSSRLFTHDALKREAVTIALLRSSKDAELLGPLKSPRPRITWGADPRPRSSTKTFAKCSTSWANNDKGIKRLSVPQGSVQPAQLRSCKEQSFGSRLMVHLHKPWSCHSFQNHYLFEYFVWSCLIFYDDTTGPEKHVQSRLHETMPASAAVHPKRNQDDVTSITATLHRLHICKLLQQLPDDGGQHSGAGETNNQYKVE